MKKSILKRFKITKSGKIMLFATLEDLSGSVELLVFPKTLETSKDAWVEGKMACIVAKTGEEEGDNKLFVEKAFELTKDNLEELKQQMAMLASYAQNEKKHFDYHAQNIQNQKTQVKLLADKLEIEISAILLKQKADEIKNILRKFPGAVQVYLKVGDKTIKTSFSVDGKSEVGGELGRLLNC